MWYEEEILDYVPYEKLRLKLTGKNLGKNPMIIRYQLNGLDDGVRITQTIEWDPSGFLLKLLHKAIEKMSRKNTAKELGKLKEYLENQNAANSY